MTYGVLGPSGYMALGRMAQAASPPPRGLDSLPRTITPEPPEDPEKVEARSETPSQGLARMLYDRDSASRGDELSVQPGQPGDPLPDMIANEPGMMSVLGLSTGSGYDALGRAYDTANFDIGSAIGGLAGNLLGGPVGGVAGSLLGRQADWNTAIGGSRSRDRDFGQGGVSEMSRGERTAFQEARDYVMNRPAPTNLTQNEARMRQQAAQMMAGGYSGGERDSQSRGISAPTDTGARPGAVSRAGDTSRGYRDSGPRGLY